MNTLTLTLTTGVLKSIAESASEVSRRRRVGTPGAVAEQAFTAPVTVVLEQVASSATLQTLTKQWKYISTPAPPFAMSVLVASFMKANCLKGFLYRGCT